VYVYLNVLGVIERCRSIVRWPVLDSLGVAEGLLAPAALGVRGELVARYLAFTLAHLANHPDSPTDDDVADWRKAVDDVMGSFASQVRDLEAGIDQGFKTVFFDNDPLADLLAAAASERGGSGLFQLETIAFCNLAESAGLESEALTALSKLAS
jgi:hypothetical protein